MTLENQIAMQWKNSLSTRLWLINVAALALSLGVLANVVIWAYDRNPEHIITRGDRMETANEVARGLRFDMTGKPREVILTERQTWLFTVAPTDLAWRVLDAQGRILLASQPAQLGGAWLDVPPGHAAGTSRHGTINHRAYLVATARVTNNGTPFIVQTATSEEFIEALASLKIKPVPRVVAVIIVISTLVFGLTLPLTIRHVLKPLREVSDAASSITPQNIRARLPMTGVPGEITPLIEAFNAALSRLEEGFNAQQQFLASAAHELQTPLTLMRGQIELQPDIKEKELFYREIDLMARHVRQLLHLAEVQESGNFNFTAVNAMDVIEDVTVYLSPKADAKAVQLLVDDFTVSPMVRADRSALFILLKNIVENAIHASPEDGIVIVRMDRDGVHVADEGPGIRESDLPSLFGRFWRSPDSNYDGTGLGLAICKEIALAHGWNISVKCSASGTRFTVDITSQCVSGVNETTHDPARMEHMTPKI